MRELMMSLLMVVVLAGLLSACGGEKKEDNSGSPAPPGQNETQSPKSSDDGKTDGNKDARDELPEDAVVQHERTFEIDENKDGPEHGYAFEDNLD